MFTIAGTTTIRTGSEKRLFRGGSFGTGLVAGMAIGAVIAIAPVGLAIGIVAEGAAAIGMDYGVKELVGWAYDQ